MNEINNSKVTEEEKKFIERVEKSVGVTFDLQNAKLYEPVGCKYCNDVGYYERVALFEVLCLDDNLKAGQHSFAHPLFNLNDLVSIHQHFHFFNASKDACSSFVCQQSFVIFVESAAFIF